MGILAGDRLIFFLGNMSDVVVGTTYNISVEKKKYKKKFSSRSPARIPIAAMTA